MAEQPVAPQPVSQLKGQAKQEQDLQNAFGPKSKTTNSLFGSPKQQQPNPAAYQHSITQIAEVNRRIRMTEEGLNNLRRKTEINEQGNIEDLKKHKIDINTLYEEVDTIKSSIKKFQEDMLKFISELQNTAKKEQLDALQKYIDLWKPVNFITRKEIKNHIYDTLEELNIQFNRPESQIEQTNRVTTKQTQHTRPVPPQTIAQEDPIEQPNKDQPFQNTEDKTTNTDNKKENQEQKESYDPFKKQRLDDLF
jgi:uncharacterized protein YoxC